MSAPVEAVAAAILKARAPKQSREAWAVAAARAAIAALREPTEAMEEAADAPFHSELRRQREISKRRGQREGYASGPFSRAAWQAMIDEALK